MIRWLLQVVPTQTFPPLASIKQLRFITEKRTNVGKSRRITDHYYRGTTEVPRDNESRGIAFAQIQYCCTPVFQSVACGVKKVAGLSLAIKGVHRTPVTCVYLFNSFHSRSSFFLCEKFLSLLGMGEENKGSGQPI